MTSTANSPSFSLSQAGTISTPLVVYLEDLTNTELPGSRNFPIRGQTPKISFIQSRRIKPETLVKTLNHE